jgi:hypothetical protein
MKILRPDAQLHRELVRELRASLTNVQSSNLVSSLDEGDTYICSTCDLAVKICAGNPTAVCILKIRQNTELDLLLHEYADLHSGARRQCVECGRPLSTRQLRKNPLLELCSLCRPRAKNSRRKNDEGVRT